MDFLKKFPFHSFLFNIYVVLFVYARNISKLSFNTTYRTLIISSLITLLLYGISILTFRSKFKAGLFCTLLLVGLFSYGFTYNTFEHQFYAGKWPFSNIHRYMILLYLTFYFSLIYLILKSHRQFINANYFLNVFIIIILSINIFKIVEYQLNETSILNEHASKNPLIKDIETPLSTIDSKKLPDIYYIILDGYANQNILEKFYNYDNSSFINFLKEKGFYVAEKSMTNYPYTSQSLSSSLNINYLNDIKTQDGNSFGDLHELISQNFVSYFLKKNNYQIVHLRSGYSVTRDFDFADQDIQIGGPNEFERGILEFTILRLDDLSGIFHYLRIKSQFKIMNTLIDIPLPKFTFIHIVSPHPPFVCNSNGNFKIHHISNVSWEPKQDYIEQLKYITSSIKKFLANVISKSKTLPIIILQSDHGPWLRNIEGENIYQARSYILNAYLTPENYKKDLYPSISPVNSFRVIFNHIFQSQLDLLPDKSPDKNEMYNNSVFKNYQK